MWILLGGLFSFVKDIISWFVGKAVSIAAKYPVLLAYIAAVVAIAGAFYASIEVTLSGLSLIFPSEYLSIVAAFIPSNLQACFSICLSVHLMDIGFRLSLQLRDKVYEITVSSMNPR